MSIWLYTSVINLLFCASGWMLHRRIDHLRTRVVILERQIAYMQINAYEEFLQTCAKDN